MTVAAEKKDERVEKRRALGRGLESLLPGPRAVTPVPVPSGTDAEETKVPRFARDDNRAQDKSVAVDVIAIQPQATPGNLVVSLDIGVIDKNPYQTRYVFDEEALAELADSIKEHGVVQPVVVRPAPEEGRYILVLGERRLRASKLAGKDVIPALVRKVSPQQAAEMTVLENVVREDLNPLEQAEAFRVLSKEFQLTQAQIAERVGVSRETVSNYMRLLRLPKKVMGYMLEDRLSFSDARLLLALENENLIEEVAEEVVTQHLKWDEIEDRVARRNGSLPPLPAQTAEQKNATGRGARWVDPNVRAAQTEMERTLGMRVRIKDRNGKGRIVIEYATVDDYERVVEMLRAKA
ncbi:MAG: ParB/RepB/Spo0J family partition protein [Candidatus Sulfotelmatobacter sp.]|nr:ParB/RepB/Spo0J family partition protein [Candidatus Sulfotelmatobacter sp.]